jgi:hypothetical protein
VRSNIANNISLTTQRLFSKINLSDEQISKEDEHYVNKIFFTQMSCLAGIGGQS